MDVHLFTTDPSGLRLVASLEPEHRVVCLIVPSNRAAALKVDALRSEAIERAIPITVHQSGGLLDADLPPAVAGVSWLYSQIIKPADLRRYPAGILNMHGGRIPAYRGANVLQWAIINGESSLGITWHGLVEAVDAGPIWAESSIPIAADANAATVRAAMIEEGLRLFPDAWRAFGQGQPKRIPNLAEGRVWPSRRPEDGRIRPGLTGRQVRDLVRALCPPWPPATIEVGGAWRAVACVRDLPAPGAVRYDATDGTSLYLVLDDRS